jgi:hypothetical protein
VHPHPQTRQGLHGGPYVHRVAPEAVQLGDHQDVAIVQLRQQGIEARPLVGRHRPRDGLPNDLAGLHTEAAGGNLGKLVVGGLVGGADAEVGKGT